MRSVSEWTSVYLMAINSLQKSYFIGSDTFDAFVARDQLGESLGHAHFYRLGKKYAGLRKIVGLENKYRKPECTYCKVES